MKKILFCFLLCLVLVFAISCGKSQEPLTDVTVYAPDGAPALALSEMMQETTLENRNVNYHIVSASTITTYVTGDAPAADFCILPVNAASKLLGNGEKYTLLGTVTHGNLYLVSKESTEITKSNLSLLVGKTVGVVNLANVPGVTFKMILSQNEVPFTTIGDDGVLDETKVNLKPIDGTQVGTDTSCDYFVAPEPAVSTKLSKIPTLHMVGNLQTLYGGAYPQAVLVVKNAFLQASPSFVDAFLLKIANVKTYLQTATPEDIVNTIEGHLTEDLAPTFTSANLTQSVISNSSVDFKTAESEKDVILSFMEDFNAIDSSKWGSMSDSFFFKK